MKSFLVLAVSIAFVLGLSTIVLGLDSLPNGLEDKGPLTKIVFIHYKQEPSHKPQHTPGNIASPSCYTILAKGAKWKTIENAQVNPTNSNLSASFLTSNTLAAREAWDAQTSQELFGNTITVNNTADVDSSSPDGFNEYVFSSYSDPNVIAVTTVWGYFFGPPQTREIVEYDVLFNTAYVWGDAAANGSVMDYLNIATHETGHGAGLGDVYDTACSEVTMYGYSAYGETKKRTLEQPDINGLRKLYGV